MSVALFDLDHTLLAGDSDYLWGEYLVDIGAVPAERHRRENERFFRDYQQGRLDVEAFLRFQLEPLAANATADLLRWRERFVRERIEPIVAPRARTLLDEHRRAGRTLAIVTSTNRFITEPIAALFGVAHLLATEPERRGERFTGAWVGVPCSGAGKVIWVERWARGLGLSLAESWFYSDSFQDLPLLEDVTHPIAVDPDERLRAHAESRGWPVMSLR